MMIIVIDILDSVNIIVTHFVDMLHINRSEISIGKELGHGQFGVCIEGSLLEIIFS